MSVLARELGWPFPWGSIMRRGRRKPLDILWESALVIMEFGSISETVELSIYALPATSAEIYLWR